MSDRSSRRLDVDAASEAEEPSLGVAAACWRGRRESSIATACSRVSRRDLDELLEPGDVNGEVRCGEQVAAA